MLLEIIALIFLTKGIGKLALQKGLKPRTWKLYTIAGWFAAEIIGIAVGVVLLNSRNLIALSLLGWIFAVGGFLIVRAALQKKPDEMPDDDINRIGVDDLRP
jgi:hypothetical protein